MDTRTIYNNPYLNDFYHVTHGTHRMYEAAGMFPTIDWEIINGITDKLGLKFVSDKNSPPLEGCPAGGVVTKEILTTINSVPIYRNFVKNLPFNPYLKTLLKEKRKAGILSEVLFWQQVHKREFHKIDFDRQRIIGNYIVDFYVKALGLVIEIDGSSHDQKAEYDAKRQAYLESLGLKVYRITDIDVKKNLGLAMSELENYIVTEYGSRSTLSQTTIGIRNTTPPAGHPSAGGEFNAFDVLDYFYAVVHSSAFREKHKESLKIDFPRESYPNDKYTFWQLVQLGREMWRIHLLENPITEQYIAQFTVGGSNTVEKQKYHEGKFYINDTQYFDNVPQFSWEFYLGGYNPAQKWLKDRQGKQLEKDDIMHFQKMIAALIETDRLIKLIDKIENVHPKT